MGSTVTLSEPGVVPLAGETASQLPDAAEALAEKPSEALELRETVCAAGFVPPTWNAKLSEAGLAVSPGALFEITNVTGTLFGLPLAPGAATETTPEYVPTARLPGATLTAILAGDVLDTVPLFGVAASQLPPVVVLVATVKLSACPLLVAVICSVAGTACPFWKKKLMPEGVVVSVVGGALMV